jgi:ribose transport system substrate-binding protein
MLNKKTMTVFTSILVLFSIIMAACGSNSAQTGASTSPSGTAGAAPSADAAAPPKKDDKFVLAFTSPALTSPAYAYMLAGTKELLDKEGQGIELKVQSPASEADAGAQVSIVENFISLGVNAIAICAMDNNAIAPAVVKANTAKIPVFAFNTPVPWPDGKVATDIGYDQRAAGKAAGEHIAKVLNGKGTVAIIQGLPSSFTTERVGGAKDALKNFPDIKVVSEQAGDWLKDKAYAVTQNILTANPDVNLVYAISDEMALGAKSAAKASGSKAYVLGLDGTMDAFDAIKNGNLDATIDTHLADEGRNIAKAAIALKNGQTLAPKMYQDPSVVSKDNATDVYNQLKTLVDKYGK